MTHNPYYSDLQEYYTYTIKFRNSGIRYCLQQFKILHKFALYLVFITRLHFRIFYSIAPIIQPSMVPKELKMEGFAFTRWLDRYNESVEQNIQWIKEGKLKYKETVTVGFENAFQAFVDMLQGGNIGKAIVKV